MNVCCQAPVTSSQLVQAFSTLDSALSSIRKADAYSDYGDSDQEHMFSIGTGAFQNVRSPFGHKSDTCVAYLKYEAGGKDQNNTGKMMIARYSTCPFASSKQPLSIFQDQFRICSSVHVLSARVKYVFLWQASGDGQLPIIRAFLPKLLRSHTLGCQACP